MRFPRLFKPAAEVKESAAGQAMVLTPNQAEWKVRNSELYAKEGYQQNVVASACVQMIADAVSSVKWTVWQGDKQLDEHPLLALMDRPNPQQSGADYTFAYMAHLMISGNAYEEKITISGKEPVELYILRSDRMSVLGGSDGFPSGFEFDGMNGRKVRWDIDLPQGVNPIWQTKLFNPLSQWYGQSPMEAGSRPIDQHTESQNWVQALLQNSARPSGALVMNQKDGAPSLSDEQYNTLKAEIEAQYSGSSNAGRPMLLEGGLEWQQMGLSPSDMGVLDTKDSSARDIALAFGVPALMLGIKGDNTYANYKEARLAFWEDTVIPYVKRTAQERTQWLGSIYEVQVKADMDHIPAVVDKRQALWEMADASTDLTINERRELKGFAPIPNGDVLSIEETPVTSDIDVKAMAHIAGYGRD